MSPRKACSAYLDIIIRGETLPSQPFPFLREVSPRAESVRGSAEVWWKWTYFVGDGGLFRFPNAEDVPPEQFTLLPALQHSIYGFHSSTTCCALAIWERFIVSDDAARGTGGIRSAGIRRCMAWSRKQQMQSPRSVPGAEDWSTMVRS